MGRDRILKEHDSERIKAFCVLLASPLLKQRPAGKTVARSIRFNAHALDSFDTIAECTFCFVPIACQVYQLGSTIDIFGIFRREPVPHRLEDRYQRGRNILNTAHCTWTIPTAHESERLGQRPFYFVMARERRQRHEPTT